MSEPSDGTTLPAETRTEFGKGAARRLRRADKIPAVIYGHGTEPRHVALPGHETMLAVKTSNALLSLTLEGGGTALTIAKDVQIDPVRRVIEHIDLVVVVRGERIEVQVPVRTTGEAAPDTVVALEQVTLAVTAEATHLPEAIEVDVTGATAGTQVTAAQVALPAGVDLAGDPEAAVVSVVAAPTAAQVEADLASAESDLGIQHDAPAAAADEVSAAGEGPGADATPAAE